MYTVYIPKYKGDTPDFSIVKVIEKFMSRTNYDCKILTAPGYMNRGDDTTSEFYDRMKSIFLKTNSNRKIEVGIFNGTNGTHISKGEINSYREKHENSIISHDFNLINLKCTKNRDYRKIMFFMRKIDDFNEELTKNNYIFFLNTIKVEGVMIGSSNQNVTTYYGRPKNYSADKGEADVFMFIDENAKNAILEDDVLANSVVISESIKVPGKSSEEYLKSILKDFLDNCLEE